MDRIGGLNYTVKSDVGGFQKGMLLSRSELNLTRREMRNSQTDAEKFANKLDVLERAFQAGAIELDDYHKTVVRLNSETPQAKAAAAEVADARRRAAEITRQMTTAEERLIEEIQTLKALKPELSAQTYERALAKLTAKLPENVAAEERRALALQRTERREKLLSDERKRGEQITRQYETQQERYDRRVQELDRRLQRGSISQATYNRAIAEAGRNLPANIAAEERRALALQRTERRQQLLNQEMQRGRAVTKGVETATERYTREVADLDRLLRRGAISQETYRRSVDQAGGALRGQRSQFLNQIPIVGRFNGLVAGMPPALAAAGIGIAAGAAGIYAFGRALDHVTSRVREQMIAIDAQAKTAAKLGMSMESLAAIRFGASEVAGVSDNTTDMAMQRLTRRTAEAAKGLGEAKQAFKDLGLDAAQLSRQDPGQVFRLIADKIAEIKDPAEQVRLTFKFFDSEGVGLVNFLREGSAGVDRFDQAAKSLDISLSAIDAANVEQANDAIARLGMRMDGMYNRLAIDFGPEITVVSQSLTGFVTGLSFAATGLSRMPDRIALVVGSLADLTNAFYRFQTLDFDGAFNSLTNLTGAKFIANANKVEQQAKEAAKNSAEKLEQDRADLRVAAEEEAAKLAQDRADIRVAAEQEAAKPSSGASAADGKTDFDEKIRKEIQSWEEMRRRAAMTAAERAEYDKSAERRSDLRAAKELYAQSIADGATETEARRLAILQFQTSEFSRQADLSDKLAKDQADSAAKAKQKADQEREKLINAGEQITKSQMTPFEKLVERLREAEVLLKSGAIDPRTAFRERQDARNQFRQSSGNEDRRPAAITRNSREAYDEVTRVFGQANKRKEDREKEALAVQIANKQATERLAEAMETLQVVQGG